MYKCIYINICIYLTALNAYKISKSSKSRKIRVSCTFAAFMSPSTSLMDESNAFYASFGCLQMYLLWGMVGNGKAMGRQFFDHMRTHASAVKGIAQEEKQQENHQVQSLATFMSRAAVASKNEEHSSSSALASLTFIYSLSGPKWTQLRLQLRSPG